MQVAEVGDGLAGGTRGAAHPADGVDEDAPAGGLGRGAVRGGQGGHDLAQGGPEGAVEAQGGVGAPVGEDEQGARLVGGEPGDVRAVAGEQRDAAVPAAFRVDGHAGGGERLDVAVDGADGHLEALGELGGGHPAPGLEQQEYRQQAVGLHVIKNAESRMPTGSSNT